MTNRRRSRRNRFLVTLVATLFLLPTMVMMFGEVDGEEFSPGRLQRRRFYYFELPVLHFQVWPVRRLEMTSATEDFLIAQDYVTQQEKAERWDLVRSRRLPGSWKPGAALTLCHYLDAVDHKGTQFWLQWSKDQPDMARILWPEVIHLAREQLYLMVPDLFQLAAVAPDAPSLQNDIRQTLAQNYAQLADIKLELHDYATAAKYYSRGLEYDPRHAGCQLGQARCRDALEAEE